jgi:hypothetical protein
LDLSAIRDDAAYAAITAARAAKVIPCRKTVIDYLYVARLVAEVAREQLGRERRFEMRIDERGPLHQTFKALKGNRRGAAHPPGRTRPSAGIGRREANRARGCGS